MPLWFVTPGAPPPPAHSSLQCAFINNMPDGAFQRTEVQFLQLLAAGSGGASIEVRGFALPGVPRGPEVQAAIEDAYFPVEDLWARPPDLLVVTGAEPRAEDVTDEPFWGALAELFGWAAEHPVSMVLSCLSAHAALYAYDGLRREGTSTKCSGVYEHRPRPGSPLTAGMTDEVLVPHSRWNGIPSGHLERAGWDVDLDSAAVGWAVASGRRGACDLVLLQGHPEYEAATLLREYRRDLARYLQGERDEAPEIPRGCVGSYDLPELIMFHLQVTQGPPDPERLDDFPFDEVGRRAVRSWEPTSVRLYTNWIDRVTERGKV